MNEVGRKRQKRFIRVQKRDGWKKTSNTRNKWPKSTYE